MMKDLRMLKGKYKKKTSNFESTQGWDRLCFSFSDLLKGGEKEFEYTKSNESYTITLKAKSPFKITNSYYEIEIQEISPHTILTMGYSTKQFPSYKYELGSISESFGFKLENSQINNTYGFGIHVFIFYISF